MPRVVNFMDAARMTASTSRETAYRVSTYFGEAGPFSYGKVRALTGRLLAGELPFRVLTAGIEKVAFELSRKCNLDVAKLLYACTAFRNCPSYQLKRALYPIDRDFALGVRPETVVVVDGVPNLVFLQPRKNPVPWAFNAPFMRRLLEELFGDYFDEFRLWLVDTEADDGDERTLKLVDLQAVSPMPEREFIRRIASLRNAWRLHLKAPAKRKERRKDQDDGQADLWS
ncbi:hypothetical protein [Croceicoccus bisphenolivorans]|uniref:hypothetical protein n=1 Tax=Croceicoccus bisphenolivorans TaxID=1783232 RepID=UPI000A9510BE|nr:hypothetical protein [Croceicoccus bisphenolivorans]